MSRRAVARLIAIIVVGYLFALLAMAGAKSDALRYPTLSHEALLAELEKGKRDFDDTFFLGLLIVGGIVVLIDGLTWLVLQAINRISPLPPPEPAPEERAGPSLHFH